MVENLVEWKVAMKAGAKADLMAAKLVAYLAKKWAGSMAVKKAER